ncbi:MAG: tyrosine--tRNA ligase [Chloroflexi bacterium]|nr:tyrosine--tRNA ligase [Chloroflexota bacterium]
MDLEEVLTRGVAEIVVEGDFNRLLRQGKPLRLKQGFDPSRPDIHLGHVVGLRKLRQLQELGHEVILIVGDWTAQIGDPSGVSTTRLMLSRDEVQANAESYMRQFFKVVDRERTQVLWQSEWFDKFTLAEVIDLCSRFTVAQMLAREDFSRRYSSNRPIAITELLYPLLQAYDSVVIKADVELGGIDQKFNCLVGRELQAMMGQPSQQVMLLPLLVGTDGHLKMSKSYGNYIAVEDPPAGMYGKVMSLPDELILDYLRLVTDVPLEEIQEYQGQIAAQSINPMVVKQRLAREVVAQFHSWEAAQKAEAHFVRVFQRRELPEEIPTVDLYPWQLRIPYQFFHSQKGQEERAPEGGLWADMPDLMVAVGLTKGRGEGKRLLAQGAVEIDGLRVLNTAAVVKSGSVIRAGKRRFLRINLLDNC